MHTDHTAGVINLCRDLGAQAFAGDPLPVFQHHYQIAQVNHTTRGAKAQLRAAGCIEPRNLGSGGGLLPIPGFSGVFAIPAGGHTPGSTMYVVQLRVFPGESEGRYPDIQTWVVTGDIVNHYQGIELGIPKPRLYSLLMVPENDPRLGDVRTFLKDLAKQPGVKLLVSHDRNQIEASGLPAY
jgi:glyoxylase-like metal-dependent hydrolase (beta-lactamase superfamily II)